MSEFEHSDNAFDSEAHYAASLALFRRAASVVPGGIYGHMSPAATLPLQSPYYASRAQGCRYYDVDGHEYIDFMCGYGPIVLGYNHAEVEEAAQRQRALGNAFNHPTPLMVELIERLVALVDFASWGVLAKNGSDVVNWSVQVAREHTGRKKIVHVNGAYHGIAPWCTPGRGGLIEEDRAHVHSFDWGNLEAFDALLERYRDEVAAVVITPFHHPVFADAVLAEISFLAGLEERCRNAGIVLILDDIRAGFRLHMGGSHRCYGFTPDLICFCKALGNGYPISATLGAEHLRLAASRVFLTGSYWNSAVPMAAALKVLEVLERDQVIEHLQGVGLRWRKGLDRLGSKYGVPFVQSGPEALPTCRFEGETNFLLFQQFCAQAMRHGVFLHPHHNWFLCAAHHPEDIDEALSRIECALRDFAQVI